jgi:hypothetical protein
LDVHQGPGVERVVNCAVGKVGPGRGHLVRVFYSNHFCPLVSYFSFLLWDDKKRVQVERQDWEVGRWTRGHLAVRPLRFLDGTPHPCAKVPTMRFSVTDASELYMTKTQVLGDYLLLWVGPAGCGLGPLEGRSLSRLYLIAWKQGSITLVSIHYLSSIGGGHGDDDGDSSGNFQRGSMELFI